MPNIYEQDLPQAEANYAALSPLSFIERSAEVYPDRLAIVHGSLRRNWAEVFTRRQHPTTHSAPNGVAQGFNDFVSEKLIIAYAWEKSNEYVGCIRARR